MNIIDHTKIGHIITITIPSVSPAIEYLSGPPNFHGIVPPPPGFEFIVNCPGCSGTQLVDIGLASGKVDTISLPAGYILIVRPGPTVVPKNVAPAAEPRIGSTPELVPPCYWCNASPFPGINALTAPPGSTPIVLANITNVSTTGTATGSLLVGHSFDTKLLSPWTNETIDSSGDIISNDDHYVPALASSDAEPLGDIVVDTDDDE